jgi:cyclopropane fatty-acyl-phospholipid synthase-like methyltransferase
MTDAAPPDTLPQDALATPDDPLSREERAAAAKAQRLFSGAWRLYEVCFFHLSSYRAAVRASLASTVKLKAGDRVLDAGCGTGLVTRALFAQAEAANISGVTFHAFDLTPQMIGRLEAWVSPGTGVETALFNVLDLEARPPGWDVYDHIVTAAMMEYLPRASLATALEGLGKLLKPDGSVLLFITRRNRVTELIVGKLWRSNLYSREELSAVISDAGFENVAFREFPGKYKRFGRSMLIAEMS